MKLNEFKVEDLPFIYFPGTVLLKAIKPLISKETKSGILVSTGVGAVEQTRYITGIVVGTSGFRYDNGKRVDIGVEVGDVIYFEEVKARDIVYKSKKYYILNETSLKEMFFKVDKDKEDAEYEYVTDLSDGQEPKPDLDLHQKEEKKFDRVEYSEGLLKSLGKSKTSGSSPHLTSWR